MSLNDNFSLLQFTGTSINFPTFRKSNTTFNIRLADDTKIILKKEKPKQKANRFVAIVKENND